MIGRQAYHHPYFLAELEHHMNSQVPLPNRRDVVEQMLPYIERELEQGERLGRITRHMVGLFAGIPGARSWRRYISEHAFRDGASAEVLLEALDAMPVAA
jgi:tRNA-dihydrouridine synthase A